MRIFCRAINHNISGKLQIASRDFKDSGKFQNKEINNVTSAESNGVIKEKNIKYSVYIYIKTLQIFSIKQV